MRRGRWGLDSLGLARCSPGTRHSGCALTNEGFFLPAARPSSSPYSFPMRACHNGCRAKARRRTVNLRVSARATHAKTLQPCPDRGGDYRFARRIVGWSQHSRASITFRL